jgi:hypothetical protein
MSYKSPFSGFDIKPSSSPWSYESKSSEYNFGGSKCSYDTYGANYNFSNGVSLGGFVSNGGCDGGPRGGGSGVGAGLSFGLKF